MPRQARIDAPGVLHHVMGRGIGRRKIFLNDIDSNDFIGRLSALAQEGVMEIYAWVLMSNHFHILCKTKNLPLASGMRKILTGYVVNFNKRHRRYGHLFQNCYKSIVCQEDVYLKELVRYIHLNLLRVGLVKDLKELNLNPWSGQSALAEKVSERYNVSMGELRSGGRRRTVVKARHAMSWIGVRELGYSGVDVARYLGVTNSCLTRIISTGRKQDIDDIKLDL